ncbi:hypothetical protein EVG20_g6877 [Dentipellis fragilis]|uniref:Uncharacterized protein n=1 Tax=Dentipellis fragilis TaxID=205917 RepID=A0A4Y9YID9_9AGAM|nr:hypothetical protein EVG20_g6877 [Dentipellis fragilis]
MPLPLADILHRGTVLALVGVSVWGMTTGYLVHRDTMRRGKVVWAYMRYRSSQSMKKDEKDEEIWAEAAQAALPSRRTQS